jgi:hypothetical protein
MILLDTSVIIDYWRKQKPEVALILDGPDVRVCGIVLAELLHGARTPAEIVATEEAVGDFDDIGIPETVWPAVGRNLCALRRAGLSLPFQDVVLATLAILNGMELWSSDGHYLEIQKVLPALRLFVGPATK